MQFVLVVSVGAFAAVAVVLPLLRLWVQSGILGFVGHRTRSPMEWLVGAGFVAANAVIGVGAGALAVFGPAAVRVSAVPFPLTLGGWSLLALGTGIVVVAQAQMGASWRIGIDPLGTTALVGRGLYGYLRHPIYGGVLVWFAGVVLTAPSAWTMVAVSIGALSVIAQSQLEEAHMTRIHGDAYRDYQRGVRRFGLF